jgi:hypothetical protein
MGLIKTKKLLPMLILAFVTGGCFDYEEKIVFNGDYSGSVHIAYTIPVYDNQERSIISFLPASLPDIRRKFESAGDVKITVADYSYRRLPIDEKDRHFPHKAVIHYRLDFERPEALKFILIGNTTVSVQGEFLNLKRTFPVNRPLEAKTSQLVKNFEGKAIETFTGKSLKFTIIFPWYYDLVTNYGTILRPGVHLHQIPLESTYNARGAIVWNIRLKANRIPQEEP